MTDSEKLSIQSLISQAGKQLRNEFENLKETNPHYAERGTETEIILSQFLNSHLPKRFSADTGLVIDHNNKISSQIDVIVFDANNSPIYRKCPKISILPIDNVAIAIEVKSKLNKAELTDAAKKIASVKKLEKKAFSNIDQPVTFSKFINTSTLGVVFAYETGTSLDTLAKNLLEINNKYPSNLWIDLVVVLDVGSVSYLVQSPFEQKMNIFGGTSDKKPITPPWYIHLTTEDSGEFTLNKFFFRLISHLTFFRKISIVDFDSLLGNQKILSKTLGAYQFNLNGELKKVDKFHGSGNFAPFSKPINIYTEGRGKFVGQITWVPWQDGCFIAYSCHLNPDFFIIPLEKLLKMKIHLIRAAKEVNVLMSQVLPLTKVDFIKLYSNLKGPFILEQSDSSQDIKL